MSKALYNKYRSQDFDQLIGQEGISKSLKNALIKNKVANAYLFVGTRGTGKTSTARILAKALNCLKLSKDGNPCNECKNCKAITEGKFMDLIEIDAASNRGIDQIRDLKEKIEFSPTEGKYKVYIIDEVHMLTKEAFNALLKTLEEPPAHVVFILATTDVHKLPATILSRCQRFDFKAGTKVDVHTLIEKVCKDEKIEINKDAIDLIVKGANGSYRDAMSLLDVIISGQKFSENPQEISANEVRNILGIPELVYIDMFIEAVVKHDEKAVISLVREMETKGVNFLQYINTLLEVLRDLLFDKVMENDSHLAWAENFTVDQLTVLILEVLGIEKSIKFSSIPALAFEVGALDLLNKASVKSNSTKTVKEEVKKVVKEVEKEEVKTPVKTVKKTEVKIAKESIKDIVDDTEEDAPDEDEDIPVSSTSLTIKEVENNWSKIVEQVKASNSHLSAFLKSARVMELSDSTLVIEVPFGFHKDLIEAVKSREAIAEVFKSILGTTCRIKCNINPSMARKKKVSSDIVMQSIPSSEPKTTSSGGSTYKPKVSKKIEAIFSGM